MATSEKEIAEMEAKHGEKMIEVKVRFFTNKIAPNKDRVIPKHAWTEGFVRIDGNASHGIRARKAQPFDSLLDVGHAIERVLIDHGIVLHPSRKMKKYLK